MSSQRCKCGVVGQQFLHLGVGAEDVFRLAGKRDPAKRPNALAKQRADIGRHEARESEGVGHALVLGHLADVVAIVEDGRAAGLHFEHGADMHGDRLRARPADRRRVLAAHRRALIERPAGGQIAVQRVVGAGLIGHRDREGCRGGPARAALRRSCPAGRPTLPGAARTPPDAVDRIVERVGVSSR